MRARADAGAIGFYCSPPCAAFLRDGVSFPPLVSSPSPLCSCPQGEEAAAFYLSPSRCVPTVLAACFLHRPFADEAVLRSPQWSKYQSQLVGSIMTGEGHGATRDTLSAVPLPSVSKTAPFSYETSSVSRRCLSLWSVSETTPFLAVCPGAKLKEHAKKVNSRRTLEESLSEDGSQVRTSVRPGFPVHDVRPGCSTSCPPLLLYNVRPSCSY